MNLSKRRKNHHLSYKAGLVYCDSSYEIKAALILDTDPNVLTYVSHRGFKNRYGKKRFLDFLITMTNGTKKITEIKPFRRLEEYKEQIEDNREYAIKNNYDFEIWTENELGFQSEHDATKWADHYLSTINGMDYVAARKQLNNEKVKRHYKEKISQDKVSIFCEFCQVEHTPLRLTYDKNIARNGRYICEKEGGKIAGSRPKKKKENPYAVDGKKQCNKCNEIKRFEEFSPDKTKTDGYSTRCKTCRAEVYRLKYQEEKKHD